MKSKKWFVRTVSAVAALTLSVGLFAGCGKNASDKDEQGRTIISVGGWPSKEGVDLDNANAKKARFEEANTDVVVNPDLWSFDLKTFYAKAAGGQLPTVYETHFTEISGIISAGYAADLTSVLKDRGYEGMFNDKLVDLICDEKGNTRAFPTATYVLGIAFNTELMEKAGLMEADGTPKQPKDWYELAEFAVKIKEATGKPGFVFPSSSHYGGWIFTPVAWSFGVDFMEQDENGKWKATFDTPEAVEALQYIKDLKWKYDVLPSNTIIDGTEYYKVFSTGGAGMMISAGDFPRRLTQYGMSPNSAGIMGIPAGPKRHVTLLGGSLWCINDKATDDQIDAAVRWLETTYTHKLTDEYKTNKLKSLDKSLSDNEIVGIKSMSVWSDKSEALAWEHQMIDEKCNINPNHVKLYNDFVANCPAEIQPEEPVCAQELYEILDGCIQEVMVNKDADCSTLIKKAVSDFQANYLDNLTY